MSVRQWVCALRSVSTTRAATNVNVGITTRSSMTISVELIVSLLFYLEQFSGSHLI